MWDDFYCEPSEFDQQIEEFKDSLRISVKEEITQELERLRKENASLIDIRNNWDRKVRELEDVYRAKKFELDKAIADAKEAAKKAKQARLQDLISEVAPVAYMVIYKSISLPKCCLCDDQRRRKYITPLGRVAYEDCECAKRKKLYHVERSPIVRISSFSNGGIRTFYLVNKYAGESWMRESDDFYDEKPFEEINVYRPLFHDENRARRYAEWMNKKEWGQRMIDKSKRKATVERSMEGARE